LASKKFLKILQIPHQEQKEQPVQPVKKQEIQDKNKEKTTFFFMGMDVPIEMTHALKKLDERSLKNPFLKDLYDIKGPDKQEESPDFYTKLSATVDKIKAYKNYFYNKGEPTGRLRVIPQQES
jgi:hypothetical protein